MNAAFSGSPRGIDVRCLGSAHFELRFPPGGRDAFGYFLFHVEGAAGKEVRIDLTRVPVRKWWSLNPVVCDDNDLADPANFVSRLPEEPREPEAAPNGPLLPDDSGERWTFIRDVTPDRKAGTLTLRHAFAADRAAVAMRPPYTPHYHENYLETLAGNEHVTVHAVGRSGAGRPLSVIQVGGQTEQERRDNPCLFVYAREHPDEHDTSWLAQGMIEYLLDEDSRFARFLRRRVTLLCMPIFDPDGAVEAKYHRITASFKTDEPSREAEAVAAFFQRWVDDLGGRLDFVVDLHNVESGECGPLACGSFPKGPTAGALAQEAHAHVYEQLRAAGLDVAKKPWSPDWYMHRLPGWTQRVHGAPWLLYEANSQAPKRHLTLGETRRVGALLFEALARHLISRDGRNIRLYAEDGAHDRLRAYLFWRGGLELKPWDSVFEIENKITFDRIGSSGEQPSFDVHPEAWANYQKRLEAYPELR